MGKLLLETLLQEADAQLSALTAQAEWLQLLITLRRQGSAQLAADLAALRTVQAEQDHWRALRATIAMRNQTPPPRGEKMDSRGWPW